MHCVGHRRIQMFTCTRQGGNGHALGQKDVGQHDDVARFHLGQIDGQELGKILWQRGDIDFSQLVLNHHA